MAGGADSDCIGELIVSDCRRRELRLRKLSKFLALLLRHRPARFPIRLDPQGYADFADVMKVVQSLPNFRWVTHDDLDTVLNLPGRRRFEVVKDEFGALRIRALYGHTVVRPDYEPVAPPEILYHGTAPEALEAILREGIRPMQRHYVHLAASSDIARSIALRHTATPVILRIDAAAAYAAGQAFYHPSNGIYLTAAVPAVYVESQ